MREEDLIAARRIENDKRAGTVGFALTILQRRLTSSPEAIYQSLRRRRERLEKRLRELEVLHRAGQVAAVLAPGVPAFDDKDVEDLDEAPDNEVEAVEEEILDQATAARSIAELKIEIETLRGLEKLALDVCHSGTDTKWRELASLLGEIFTVAASEGKGPARATLDGPHKIPPAQALATPEARPFHRASRHAQLSRGPHHDAAGAARPLSSIHGSMGREDRVKAQESFKHDPVVRVLLLATDAAGEGINLQRAHLMVNYDLPWNPNRLEQRFGRIHRIGQTEVCHLWNLVADETREGDVYRTLLEKA